MLSITVDPALIFNLFRVFAALACIAISGFLLVYFAFGIRHPLTAIATALPIGLASTLLVSNLLAYILGTPRALTWGLLAVFVITSLIAVARRHLFKPVQPVSWLDGALFAAAGILLLILSVANYAVLTTSSYYIHFWLANTIRFGNFPVMSPGAPMLPAEYHYGADYLAALLAHVGQVDSAIIFFILTPLAATSAYLAASMVAAKVLGNLRLGLLAGLFFSFGAGLPYLLAPVRYIHLRWFNPSTAASQNELLDYYQRISPNAFEAYPRFISSVHYIVPWAILLSCIALAAHLNSRLSGEDRQDTHWTLWALLGTLFASIALVEESIFALGLVGWGTLALWQTATQRTPVYLRSFVVAALPAALLALLQGGVFADALFSSSPDDQGFIAAFNFHLLPQFTGLSPRFGATELQFIHPPPWGVVYLITLGLPLLIAPALIIWALGSKRPTPYIWLASIGLVGFIVPHFITHEYSSNFLRWLEFSHASFAFLLGMGTLTLVSFMRNRTLAWTLAVTCTALTIAWPLAGSIRNVATERNVTLGQSIEDHWTISPPLRQRDQTDWITGRPYTFLMSGEARQFLGTLPPTARVLTNRFPEVPLLIRGLAPHKNTERISYTYFRFPSGTYLDALYALDPTAMQQYGITHLVINLKWFRNSPSSVQALLEVPRYFSLLFSDEQFHEGLAWHRVYAVLPAFYEERPQVSQDLLRSLPELVPQDASVYVSPAIPPDIRWAFLYALRQRQLASGLMDEHHIRTSFVIAEPLPRDRYDFALLIDEPPGERWLNWAFTPQDLPSVWGLHSSQRVWHALGVGLYALNTGDCPGRSVASVPPFWHLPANASTTLNLDCLQTEAGGNGEGSSLLLTILSPKTSQVEIAVNGLSQTVLLDPGANQVPLNFPDAPGLSLIPTDSLWVRAQRVPQSSAKPQAGIPALLLLPTFDGEALTVSAHFYGARHNPQESKLVWELVKQRRIYGHWWHWSSSSRVGEWPLALAEPPDHGDQFTFALNFSTLETEFALNGRTITMDREVSLPANPGEPYAVYFTLIRVGTRAHSLPVAWITYSPEEVPSVLLAPRLILVDEALPQD